MNFVRRKLPVIIVFCVGMTMMLRFYVPRHESEVLLTLIPIWLQVIAGFTVVIGIFSLLRVHFRRISRQQPGWGYSAVMYVALFVTVFTGVIPGIGRYELGIESGSPFMWIFNNVNAPAASAMFSILGFYVASAAYRAFRAKNLDATIMLIAAIIVMFGRVPLADLVSQPLPEALKITNLTSWILNVPTVAAKRAIYLGIGLGTVGTALKIIFGLERTYMGGGD